MTAMLSEPPVNSPTLVALETSTELASVAVLHRGRLLSRESSGAQTHSASVLPMLQALLKEAEISLADCAALAYGCGPGSFTGVRTACGLVQGLATGAQRKVAPVVTLLAMADAAREGGAGDEVVAVLDARMGEVYWAHYVFDGDWRIIAAPALSKAAEVIAAGKVAVCGNGLLAYPNAFEQINAAPRFPDVVPHASSIARLAVRAVERGELIAPRDAQPLYLRNKVALTTSERSVVGAGAAA
jgi:tRNA threonylcarbamoyladenosine biosynthesis protein TsaB